MQKQKEVHTILQKDELGIINHVNDVSLAFSSALELDFQSGQMYMNLLRIGPSTTGALAKEMKIDRNKVYRKIEELVSTGFVSMTLSSPKLCIPIDPENAIELILQKKQKEIEKKKVMISGFKVKNPNPTIKPQLEVKTNSQCISKESLKKNEDDLMNSLFNQNPMYGQTMSTLKQFSKYKIEMATRQVEIEKKLSKALDDKIHQNLESLALHEIVSAPFGTSIPTFRVIQGLENIYSDISRSIGNSKDTVYLVTSIKDIVKMYHSDIPEKIKKCKKNGGKVFLITDSDEKAMIPYIKRINATENKIGKLPSNGRILVFGDKQMFMSDSANANGFMDESSDISLCTDATEMTNNILKLCQFLWDVATPLN